MQEENSIKILQDLWAFWQHFGIYKRKSDFSWKSIISCFSSKCPYPVWHNDEWLENSNPPFWVYDKNKDFWKQIWELFSKCPIAHNISIWNENSEYADDCWYSKNCYLCHSLYKCENVKYSYRVISLKDCYFCVFSFDSQLCIDLIYWFDCYLVKYAIDVKRCKNSAFLFDCRDCENCFLCWNLRNKKYCFWNKQLSREEYEAEIKKYDLNSRKVYEDLKNQFSLFIKKNAWWKSIHFDNVENSTWDYLSDCKNCENCFYINQSEECNNSARCFNCKNIKNTVSILESQKINYSVNAQDNCFNANYCSNVIRSKNLEYCINCLDCENCFLCAWLIWKKYFILNKEFSVENYEIEKEKIIQDMKLKWIYGNFFPAYFSATSYDESLSWIYTPLSIDEQKKQWFRVIEEDFWNKADFKNLSDLPDKIDEISDETKKWWFWDEISKRPFQILGEDIEFYKKLKVPLNDRFYIRRIKENFYWMFPTYKLRKTNCVKSNEEILTILPKELDWRILSLKEYEKLIY